MSITETLDGQLDLPRIPYSIVTIRLDEARNNELVITNIEADFLAAIDLVNPSGTPVLLRLNYPNAAPIPLESGRTITAPPEFLKRRYALAGIVVPPPIKRLYLTHGACPGGAMTLGIGGDASFLIGTSGTVVVVGISTLISQIEALRAVTASELQRAITGVDISAVLASTATPLLAGSTWTSGWFALDRFATVVLTCVADQATQLWIHQSWDATFADVDAVETRHYPHLHGALGVGDGYYSGVVAPWGRIQARNTSAVNQSILRIRAGGRAI